MQLKTTPRSAQLEHFKFLAKKKAAILVDHVGNGKTICELMCYLSFKERGHCDFLLVLTPRSAYEKKVWKNEVEQHTYESCIDLEILAENAAFDSDRAISLLKKYPIVYGKHTHCEKYAGFIKRIASKYKMFLVADEFHAFKQPRTAKTKSFIPVRESAAIFHGVTGTPLSKNLEDAYNLIQITKPWYLGSFIYFRDYYCETKQVVIGRMPGGKLKTVDEIVGLLKQKEFEQKVSQIVSSGHAVIKPKFHYYSYEMSDDEKHIYRLIAKGIFDPELEFEEGDTWLSKVLSQEYEERDYQMKEVKRHSSRFIYLQFAADGLISYDGSIGKCAGNKYTEVLKIIDEKINKSQSIIMYFSFYASLYAMETLLKETYGSKIRILKSTGEDVMKDNIVTEASVKQKPTIILCTKAGSESVSYYFINNVILFHVPTEPVTYTQIVGRVTRINSLYPDDINVYLPDAYNIDMYKQTVIGRRARQLEILTNEEANIPDKYKEMSSDPDDIKIVKRVCLWDNRQL